MHYYQFNIADYRKDTSHLSRLEHSIYRDLIDWYYLDESPIPKETQSVTRRLRLGTQEETTALSNVLNDFFYLSELGWNHKRIDMEIADYHSKCDKNKENGKKGGRPKSSVETEKTQSVILANPNESESNPNHKPLTNNQEPVLNTIDTNVSIVRNEIQIPDQDDIVNQNIPDCPHKEIISLYAKHLPMGIQPREWDGARAATLKARWREKKKRQDLGWWDGFFKHASESKFLTGQVSTKDRAAFEITLPWMLKSENFKKIIEGVYHR